MTSRPILAAIAALALPAVASAQVQFNEIRVGQPGFDTQEYVELRAAAGTSLAGLTLIVIGDAEGQTPPTQNGVIEEVIALSGSVGASGYFVIAESSFTLALADLVRPLNFEDPDNVTFLLVSGFSGNLGQSLDFNLDGSLDVTPWTAIADSVALVSTQTPDGVTSDFVYSATRVGPDGSASPSYIRRCLNTGTWQVGAADLSVAGDTPGADNPTCSTGGETVRISEVRVDMPGADDNEYFELEGPPGTLLNGYTYIVLGDGNDPLDVGVIETVVSLDGVVIPASGYLLVAEPTFTLATPDFITLPNALNFENSDNVTHMLVRGFTGALGDDLHTGTSCVLDATPWTAVVDAVGLRGPDTTCIFADEYTGPDGAFTVAHAYRCAPEGDWTKGAFSIEYSGDTPGAANRTCAAGPPVECGDKGTGSCSEARETPFCDDQTCCTNVCAIDPTCCDVAWDAECVTQAEVTCAGGESSCDRGTVSLNEIRIDMTGTDTREFIEIAGTPGAVLDVTIVIIGDGSGGSGWVERVRSLAGVAVPADGTLLVGNPAVIPDVGNGAGTGGSDVNENWIENGDNITIFLVRGWTGTVNQDLDTNDDGVLDVTPWTEIVDGIALIETTTEPPTGDSEWAYGDNRIGPDGPFVPGHIWRCRDTGCWNIGLFDVAANQAAGNETPGTDNAACGVANPCPADINGDDTVGGLDLTSLLAAWGGNDPAADIDDDGTVGGLDLTALLAAWGPCP